MNPVSSVLESAEIYPNDLVPLIYQILCQCSKDSTSGDEKLLQVAVLRVPHCNVRDFCASSVEKAGSISKRFDSFYIECGSESIKSMCSFKVSKFGEFWMMLVTHVSATLES